MSLFYEVDQYGVRNYKTFPILAIASIAFMVIVATAAHIVLSYELDNPEANVKNYYDSFWLCFMAASTIGFGDFYPTTTGGRVIIGNMFIVGGVMLGIIIGLVSQKMMAFTDTSVKNKELRKQNQELLQHNIKLEGTLSELLSHNVHLESSLRELQAHNETILVHNKLVESKLDILMEHMDEVTDLEMDIDKKLDEVVSLERQRPKHTEEN